MRKITLSIIFSILCHIGIYAQENAIAKVHYIFKHINDTTQRDKHLQDEVVTYLGQHSSYYTSYSGERSKEEMDKQLKDPAFDGNLILSRNTSAIKESYLIDNSTTSAKEIVQIASDMFTTDIVYPTQDWTIAEETKEIGGYTCQKATATFKGRNYTAWFTTELPFAAGPWKLHGLPGLILEAHDTNNEVAFTYAGFDKLTDASFKIGVPEKALASTKKEIEKLQAAFVANPNAYLQSKGKTTRIPANNASGGAIVVAKGTGSPAKTNSTIDMSRIKSMTVKNADNYKPSKTMNNPIELIP